MVINMPGFSLEIRMQLYMAAGCICMSDGCNNKLSAPTTPGKQLIIGEGAHIISEALKGPRHRELADYDTFDNGIALCANCHRMVDHIPSLHIYTIEKLRGWKTTAMVLARQGIGKPVITGNFDRRHEWTIADNFSKELNLLIAELRDFTKGWEIPDKALMKITVGSRGFVPSNRWGPRHPLRSVDPAYCYRQDAIIESLESLQSTIQKRPWHYSRHNEPSIKRFAQEMNFESVEKNTSDQAYATEVAGKLIEFKNIAYDFVKGH